MGLVLSGCKDDKANETIGNNNGVMLDKVESESLSRPPEGEYSEILFEDGRYFLCKKVQSGFSENSEQYGIYDGKDKVWSLDYKEYKAELPTITFDSHGEGMFSYQYSLYYGTRVFLSAELGGSFNVKKSIEQSSIHFDDGKALVLVGKDSKFVDGRLTPNEELVWIDKFGNIEEVSVQGFDASINLYWNVFLPSGNACQDIYVREFFTYINEQETHYIYVYFCDTNESIVINNQEYASRMNNSGVSASLHKDLLRLTSLPGDDGEKYYAEFDREGNLVTEATPMKEIYY